MAVTPKVDAGAVIQTTSAIAGTVANMIVPGSGPLVSKITEVGGTIIKSVVDLFSSKKKAGMTDAQIQNDAQFKAASTAAAAELETLYTFSANEAYKWEQYLGKMTDADRVFATMRKDAKMRQAVLPQAGKLSGDVFTYNGKSLKVSDLVVYAPLFDGSGYVDSSGMVVTGDQAGSGGTVKTGTAVQGSYSQEQEEEVSSSGAGFGILLAIVMFFIALFQWNGGKPTRAEITRNKRRRSAKKAREAKAAKKEAEEKAAARRPATRRKPKTS